MSTKKILIIIIIGLLLVCTSAMFGAAGGAYVIYRLEHQDLALTQQEAQTAGEVEVTINDETNSSTPETVFISNTDIETTITNVVQDVGPAVVTVVGTTVVQSFPYSHTSTSEVSGSGVFISDQGYILTSNHVVEDTSELSVILSDGTQQSATVVGSDVYADCAILKTEGTVPAVAVLGNSDTLDPGETVIAIGSPLGDFKNSVTVGVVSATGRSVDTGYGYKIEDLIQTDAAINEGNSGGPLVNLAGEVIGINTLVVRSSDSGTTAEGLGFAISSNTVKAIASQIIEKGVFTRPYLGIQWQTISPSLANRYRLAVEYGVIVTEVISGSPADQAGLQNGDIITQIGDVELSEDNSYINVLFQYNPGEVISIKLIRNQQQKTIQVTLGES